MVLDQGVIYLECSEPGRSIAEKGPSKVSIYSRYAVERTMLGSVRPLMNLRRLMFLTVAGSDTPSARDEGRRYLT